MTRAQLTETIRENRRRLGLTFADLAERAGADRVHLTAALLGQHPLDTQQAAAVAEALELPEGAAALLREIPTRGSFESLPPSDPTIYRLYEVLQVYGPALKELIHEDFGDGIMSAINFRLGLERADSESGPRVRITLDGKFLPYAWE